MALRVLLTAVMAASLLAGGFGQSLDDLFSKNVQRAAGAVINGALAKSKEVDLKGSAARYNSEQPSFPFRGATLEVRFVATPYEWSREAQTWRQAGVNQFLSALGSKVLWGREGIGDETDSRGYYRGNDEVNQSSLPDKGTILAASHSLELTFIQLEREEDLKVFLGRWWRGADFRLSREVAYCGIAATIRNRTTGEVVAVFKVLESASSADNVGANIASGFFGSHFGGEYRADSREALRLRAEEKALKALGEVFKAKNSSP